MRGNTWCGGSGGVIIRILKGNCLELECNVIRMLDAQKVLEWRDISQEDENVSNNDWILSRTSLGIPHDVWRMQRTSHDLAVKTGVVFQEAQHVRNPPTSALEQECLLNRDYHNKTQQLSSSSLDMMRWPEGLITSRNNIQLISTLT